MFSPLRWLLGKAVLMQAKRFRAKFRTLTIDPRKTQRDWLLRRLSEHKDTAFGRDHGFADIRTVEDFRRRIPITTYDYFAPYIERVKAGEYSAMFHNQRVIMFAMTSGTTNTRKFIPVTEQFLNDYRRGTTIWGLQMFEDHKELWFKTMVQLVSDWDEFRTSADIPCGSISGLTTQMQRYVVRKTYCLPAASGKIKDIQSKYYLAWRLGLVRDVGIFVSANPSTMVSIARFGDEIKDILIRDIHDGTIDSRFQISDQIRRIEKKRLGANKARAKELEAIVRRTDRLLPKDVWPNLGLIGNWTGGSVGAYMRNYPEYYGNPAIRDLGLVASEGRMTVPFHDFTSGGTLEITSSFFEFVPVDEMGSPDPTVLESHELQEGRDYFILLSTSSGLYRYNIHDVVRCVGWHERTPILEFLNKGSNFSNLTGEKISEHHATQAVIKAAESVGVRLAAFTLAPIWEEPYPHYGLFVEVSDFADESQRVRFAEKVEEHLRIENTEYEAKRDSLRLGPIRLKLLQKGFWRSWDTERLMRTGGTAEQYKHPNLIANVEFCTQIQILNG